MLESVLEVGTFSFSRKVLSWIWPMTTKHAKQITYQTKLCRRYSSIVQNITNIPSTSILSILCFAMSTTQRWGTFPVCRVGFGYHIVLGPLFWQCPQPLAFTVKGLTQGSSRLGYQCTWPFVHALSFLLGKQFDTVKTLLIRCKTPPLLRTHLTSRSVVSPYAIGPSKTKTSYKVTHLNTIPVKVGFNRNIFMEHC
jgi:hypothetical protein